jgi:hypothetical protein
VQAENNIGGGGNLVIRLVGCRGYVDHFLVSGFTLADYYVKVLAGAEGGVLRFANFCIDNEGFQCVPQRAVLYAEPSLDGGKSGNVLQIAGTIYTGTLFKARAVLELADPPGPINRKASGKIDVDSFDMWIPKESVGKGKIGAIVLCHGPNWSGRLMAESVWGEKTINGLVQYTGKAGSIVTYQESYALPNQGTWLEGCNTVRVPDRQDPKTGAWVFKTYRCSRSGTYGTGNEPEWQEIGGSTR